MICNNHLLIRIFCIPNGHLLNFTYLMLGCQLLTFDCKCIVVVVIRRDEFAEYLNKTDKEDAAVSAPHSSQPDDTDSDYLLAKALQYEFDLEHDIEIDRNQKHQNRFNSKGLFYIFSKCKANRKTLWMCLYNICY